MTPVLVLSDEKLRNAADRVRRGHGVDPIGQRLRPARPAKVKLDARHGDEDLRQSISR